MRIDNTANWVLFDVDEVNDLRTDAQIKHHKYDSCYW